MRTSRNGDLRAVAWPKAVRYAADRFADMVRRYGPQAVAFYGSGQLDSEAAYLAVKLFKGCLGTNNTDSNSRLCMASAALGYATSLGSDGPPTCYDDIDEADLVLIIGSNMAEAHPVTFDRLKARRTGAASAPGVVVIDPRRTKTAEHADLHVALAPGSDVALMNVLLGRLATRGTLDNRFLQQHVDNAAELRAFLAEIDDGALLQATGLPSRQVDALVDRIADSRAMLSFYCMGLGQSSSGLAKHHALLNLHLATGQIGKPGAGPFSLTGQPNAMGGREVGLLAHQLPGYRLAASADHRREVEQHWQLPAGAICEAPGLTAVEMFRGLESGRLKAIWIAATNPAASLPDLHHVRRALERAELVIVQDVFHPTETSRFAHVLLPAANWVEKEGTSTNSERMVSYSQRLLPPPGAARPDWQIIAGMAQAMGFPGFEYADATAVWDEFIGLTAGRPCDMAGISAERLRREKSLQWPCSDAAHPGTKRRYLDRRFPTPTGRARLHFSHAHPPKEAADAEFPLVLTTGRIYGHWHTLTRTGKSEKLLARDREPYVELHPHDAMRIGVGEGDLISIQSRRGVIRLPVRIVNSLQPGLLFAPFHWGDLWGEDRAVNYLTIAALDPQSKQPELKYCAVAAERVIDASREAIPADQTTDSGSFFRWLPRVAAEL